MAMDADDKKSLLIDLCADIVNSHGVNSFQADDFRDRHGAVPGFLEQADAIDALKRTFAAGGPEQADR